MDLKMLEEDYDPVLSKFCSSLLWFVCRMSEHGVMDIPSEITNPVEVTAANSILVRPAVVDYLTNGSLYLKVSSSIYQEPLYSLWELIQKLSHNGVYVMDQNDEAVTDQDLMEKFPFKMSAHLSLMDAIMLIYANSIVTVQMIVNAVRTFSTFNASKELPFDLEDGLLLWLNKINHCNTKDYIDNSSAKRDNSNNTQTYRFHKDHLIEKQIFPTLADLNECFKDGITALSIVLFYFPEQLTIDSINLSSNLTVQQKIDNIETFRSLCADNICTSVFALRMEDFLFTKDELKQNFLVLLCEIFVKTEEMQNRNEVGRSYTIISADNNSLSSSKSSSVTSSTASSINNRKDQYSPTNQRSEQTRDNASHSGKMASGRTPLLSKRSKQQFAKFDSDIGQDVPKVNALQYDDLDMKQSHTIPSTIHGGHRRNTPRAWETGSESDEDLINMKQRPQKISLDFRPSSGSTYRSNIRSSNSTDSSQVVSSTDTYFVNQDSRKFDYSPTSSQTSLSYSDGVRLVEEAANSMSEASFQADRNGSHTCSSVSTEKDSDRGIRESFSENQSSIVHPVSYSNYSSGNSRNNSAVLKKTQQYLLSKTVDSANSSSTCQESSQKFNSNFEEENASQNKIQQLSKPHSPHPQISRSSHETHDPYDEEDALSTITETTEPENPSLYSFHSSASSTSTVNDSSDERMKLSPAKEGGGFFLDDFDDRIYPGHIKFTEQLSKHSFSGSNETLKDENSEKIDESDTGELDGTFTDKNNEVHSAVRQCNLNGEELSEPPLPSYATEDISVRKSREKKSVNELTFENEIKRSIESSQLRDNISISESSSFPNELVKRQSYEEEARYKERNDRSIKGEQSLIVKRQENDIVEREEINTINSSKLTKFKNQKEKNVAAADSHGHKEDTKKPMEESILPGILSQRNIKESMENHLMLNYKNQGDIPRKIVYYDCWPFVRNNSTINSMERLTLHHLNRDFYDGVQSPIKTSWAEIFSKQTKEYSIEEEYHKLQLHKKRYKSSSVRWIDFINKNENISESAEEPLSTRLAALRMQLEEKRRQFEEEKQKKQQQWSQERARELQDALYDVNEKENQDPSRQRMTSWVVDFSNDNDDQQDIQGQGTAGEPKPYISPKEYIRQKQLEKEIEEQSPGKGAWFVGLNENETENSKTDIPQSLINNNNSLQESFNMLTEFRHSNKNIDLLSDEDEKESSNELQEEMTEPIDGSHNFNKNLQNSDRNLSNSLSQLKLLTDNTSKQIARAKDEKPQVTQSVDELIDDNGANLPNDTESRKRYDYKGKEVDNASFRKTNNVQEFQRTQYVHEQRPVEDQQTNKIDTPKPSNVPQHEQKQPVSVSNIKSGTSYSEMHMSADINNLQRVVPNFVPEFSQQGNYQMPGNHVEEKDVQSENVLLPQPINGHITGTKIDTLPFVPPSSKLDESRTVLPNDRNQQSAAYNVEVRSNLEIHDKPNQVETRLELEAQYTSKSRDNSSLAQVQLTPNQEETNAGFQIQHPPNQVESSSVLQTHHAQSQVEVTSVQHIQNIPNENLSNSGTNNVTPNQQNGVLTDQVVEQSPDLNTTPVIQKTQSHVQSGSESNEKSAAWAVTFDEFESPEMTPEQKKKRDRFLRNRQKRQEAEKAKKEANAEKQKRKEEKVLQEKSKEEKLKEEKRLLELELKRRELEHQRELELLEAANRLQQENFSKRIHEITYNMNMEQQRPFIEQQQFFLQAQQRQNTEVLERPMNSYSRQSNSGGRRPQSNIASSPDFSQPGDPNGQFSEYKGPAVYQKPSGKSNRKIMQNAISHCCLCGEVNKEAKKKCLEAIAQSEGIHFLVLFREGLKFRSVYEYNPDTGAVTRIYGIGPKAIIPKNINKYLKYNSGAKEFYSLDTKHLSIQIDGIMIKKELWEKKQGPSKTDSNLKKRIPPSGRPYSHR